MARHEHLPIYKAALDMTVHFEKLVAGFSLARLDRRVAGMVAAGRSATFVAQCDESGGGLMPRVPVALWVARNPFRAVRERPV